MPQWNGKEENPGKSVPHGQATDIKTLAVLGATAVIDMPPSEIAEHVGLSVNTVQTIIRRWKGFDGTRDLLKALGHEMLENSAMAASMLKHRMMKGHKFTNVELNYVAGIGAQRGRELLDTPDKLESPDWSALSAKLDTTTKPVHRDENEPVLTETPGNETEG